MHGPDHPGLLRCRAVDCDRRWRRLSAAVLINRGRLPAQRRCPARVLCQPAGAGRRVLPAAVARPALGPRQGERTAAMALFNRASYYPAGPAGGGADQSRLT
ncbi:MAG: hypothetical protein MZV70_71705 [Desulfobacterales bacterium]|nr:hypothetical protein [Desulfobacterales bacterium]